MSTADPRQAFEEQNEGGLDSDNRLGHAPSVVRRGNSGGKGFAKPGSIPSANRQARDGERVPLARVLGLGQLT